MKELQKQRTSLGGGGGGGVGLGGLELWEPGNQKQIIEFYIKLYNLLVHENKM